MTKHRHPLLALLLALSAPEAQSEQYTCVIQVSAADSEKRFIVSGKYAGLLSKYNVEKRRKSRHLFSKDHQFA